MPVAKAMTHWTGVRSLFALSCALSAFVAPTRADRKFTVNNNCGSTIWPAVFTGPSMGTAGPNLGWEAPAQSSMSVAIPDTWVTGVIWARQGCQSSGNGALKCAIGDCGGMNCTSYPTGGFTRTEWSIGTLSADFYDISNVGGSTLPVEIKTNSACPTISCPVSFIKNCPTELQGVKDSSGTLLSCLSSCSANLGNASQHDNNCCVGSFSSPSACSPATIQYYDWYSSGCPQAYSYPFDDQSAIHSNQTCPGVQNADYTVTFCPVGASDIAAPASDFSPAASGASSPTPSRTSSSLTISNTLSSTSPTMSSVGSPSASAHATGSAPLASAAAPSSSVLVTQNAVLSGGALAGIVVGAVAALLAVGVAVWLARRRRRRGPPLTTLPVEEDIKPFHPVLPAPAPVMSYAPASSASAPASSKRALMMAEAASADTSHAPSAASHAASGPVSSDAASTSASAASPHPARPPASGAPPAEFEEMFQARLAQFLQEHMDAPDSQHDGTLPRYPG